MTLCEQIQQKPEEAMKVAAVPPVQQKPEEAMKVAAVPPVQLPAASEETVVTYRP